MKAARTKSLIDRKALLERFLRYVRIDSSCDPSSDSTPSAERQWDLARLLKKELEELGVPDVSLTDKCCVVGRLPSNSEHEVPGVAFMAHLDTSDACPGKAEPIVRRNYQGETLSFPRNPKLSLSPESCPALKGKSGHDIVTASGDSLLGGDDKAGIAVVIAGLQALLAHPEIKHGPIVACFNPDEEIGRGAEAIPVKELGVVAAYTFDSEGRGEINFETFNADRADLSVVGVPAHPGSAKGKLVNALKIVAKFIDALPKGACPERTSGRQGFIHPVAFEGSASEAGAEFILRDFSDEGMRRWRETLEAICEKLRKRHPEAKIELAFKKQYRNMRKRLENDMRPVEIALKAIRKAGLKPVRRAVRGGTDGSRLTETGLPTPNIFNGSCDPHSLLEWVSVQDMEAAAETMLELAKAWTEER